jgi:hypothetical protein
MNRRNFVGTLGTGAIVGVTAPSVLVQVACGGNAVTQIGIVISAFDEALPIISDFLPQSVALITKALAVAKDLKKALETKSGNVVEFLNQLIAPNGLFNQIMDTLGLIQDASQRKIVSGLLLLAGIALRIIATQFDQGATDRQKSSAKASNARAAATIEKASQSDSLESLLKAARF